MSLRDRTRGKVKARRQKALPLKAKRRGGSSTADRKTNVARLNRELSEAFEQQAATAEILNVISNSPTDTQPVFDAIVQSGLKLFPGALISVALRYGETINAAAVAAPDPARVEAWRRTISRTPLVRNYMHGAALLDRRIVDIPDVADAPAEFLAGGQNFLTSGNRAITIMPMMRGDEAIGLLSVVRLVPGPLSDKQIAVLKTFASQAVIAIENTRLLKELRESLQQQTATAEVLKVISRSAFDLQAVLNTLVESAVTLSGAHTGTIFQKRGELYHLTAQHGYTREMMEYGRANPIAPGIGSNVGRTAMTGTVVQIPDVLADSDFTAYGYQRVGNFRAMLGIPLKRDGKVEGVFSLAKRDVGLFEPRHVELLQTFADQAMIAIGNVQLFEEVQHRTRELSEALTYQTGSANILRVIASSPTDVKPVLEAIVESACELCDSNDAAVLLKDGDDLRFRAHHGPIDINVEKWPINRRWTAGRAFLDGEPVHLRDAWSEEGKEFPDSKALSDATNSADIRTVLSVPLMRENDRVGAIVLRRTEVRPFSDKQINLLKTFADQAVIAIGNVRLFDEVQARTRDLTASLQQQTATADVLKVISASPGELEPVFQAMLENAVRLCEAKFAMLFLYEGNQFRAVGKWNLPPAYAEFLKNNTIVADPKVPLGRVVITKQAVQVADVLLDQSYIEGFPGMVGVAEGGGARTLLQVPMLKENELVGTIGIYRQEVRPFTDKQIALVQNFAAQAVIAIENARLLNELRQRTADLSRSLDDLRAAQDRLVQTEKLASLGQLTAGIAHEIKNPLNFVNNFSALSAELTGELNDLLRDAALTDKMRQEVGELTRLLQDNLEKVVQHGKRADSIVKNMLLHSREGSGEQRATDINALVDESLNLAYHGARAEKSGFNIILERDFDPSIGTAELFPQEITRALLNLISNGFYAATKRQKENGQQDFEPMLLAATKNLGSAVEIRIRDNGTGIPSEVKDKMFNPFFTTKPAGEGTGLGLSMTHDIIVKQHGGRIDVATEVGQFTEFKIVLPRSGSKQ
jgi:two-component system NtrC family sensor kinase